MKRKLLSILLSTIIILSALSFAACKESVVLQGSEHNETLKTFDVPYEYKLGWDNFPTGIFGVTYEEFFSGSRNGEAPASMQTYFVEYYENDAYFTAAYIDKSFTGNIKKIHDKIYERQSLTPYYGEPNFAITPDKSLIDGKIYHLYRHLQYSDPEYMEQYGITWYTTTDLKTLPFTYEDKVLTLVLRSKDLKILSNAATDEVINVTKKVFARVILKKNLGGYAEKAPYISEEEMMSHDEPIFMKTTGKYLLAGGDNIADIPFINITDVFRAIYIDRGQRKVEGNTVLNVGFLPWDIVPPAPGEYVPRTFEEEINEAFIEEKDGVRIYDLSKIIQLLKDTHL